jgi:hypothetical protein
MGPLVGFKDQLNAAKLLAIVGKKVSTLPD